MQPWEDPNNEGNGPAHRSGHQCFDCGSADAGTRWSPYFCFACNVTRMRRIDASFAALEARFQARTQQEQRP